MSSCRYGRSCKLPVHENRHPRADRRTRANTNTLLKVSGSLSLRKGKYWREAFRRHCAQTAESHAASMATAVHKLDARFLEHFSCKRWNKLDKPSRSQHTLSSCAPCAWLTSWHASFPAKSSRVDLLPAAARKAPAVSSAAAPLAVRTETALKHLNKEWKKETRVSFEDAVVQASGTTLQKKTYNKSEKKTIKKNSCKCI